MKPCLLAGGDLESVLWERPINLAPKADFNHGFIGLFHWGMGFCSNGAKFNDPIPLLSLSRPNLS